jgi:hypothetical protein
MFTHYDFLMKMRPQKTIDPSLLLIDTGGVESDALVESALALSVVDALIELNAEALVIQTPLLGASGANSAEGESDLLAGFDREFSIIAGNIRNLFEGILMGFIPPEEAPLFVEETVKLTEAGKERLLQAAFQSSEELSEQIEKAGLVFGAVFMANDLNVPLIQGKNQEAARFRRGAFTQGFSRVNPSPDGLVRGAPPIRTIEVSGGGAFSAVVEEHVVLVALKERFAETSFSKTERGQALILLPKAGGENARIKLELDDSGAVLFDHSAFSHNLKSIPISLFIDYDDAGKTLYRLLSQAVTLVQYGKINPENYPPFIYEKNALLYQNMLDLKAAEIAPANLAVRAELEPATEAAASETEGLDEEAILEAEDAAGPIVETSAAPEAAEMEAVEPDFSGVEGGVDEVAAAESRKAVEDAKILWQEGRKAYFAACEAFFSETTEQAVRDSFNELIQSENLGEEGERRLLEMREKELEKFYIARDIYFLLRDSRNVLAKNLNGAFCVMGAASGESLSDAEVSILLADALLGGEAVIPLSLNYACFFAVLAVLTAVFMLCALPPLVSFVFAAAFPAVLFAAAAQVFLAAPYWLDPFFPAVPAAAAAFASSLIALAARLDAERNAALICGSSIPKQYSKTLLKYASGKDSPAFAAFVAVRAPDFPVVESRQEAEAALKLLKQFHEEAKALFFKAGAVLAGIERDLLVFSFGSPLERLAQNKTALQPVRKAASVLAGVDFSKLKTAPWYIGMDAGVCIFCSMDGVCCHASGQAAARARLLSSLAERSKVRVLVSKTAAAHLDVSKISPLSSNFPESELCCVLKTGV